MVINGAGAAAIAGVRHYMDLGVKKENVVMCDRSGVIYKGRQGKPNPHKEQFASDTEARTLASIVALRKAMKNYGARHSLSFHSSIAKAEAFQKSQEQFGRAVEGYDNVDSFHVSSKVSTGARKSEIEKFSLSKRALITNAKCLTEGVDVPAIDAVLFADPKRSTIDIVQAVGRALRPADGKKMGLCCRASASR